MIEQRGQLKVYSYVGPYCRRFNEQQFKEVGQFQHAVEEWFKIPVQDQKLVKDGKVIEDKWLKVSFQQLNIEEDTHLVVLTKESRIRKKKNIAQVSNKEPDESVSVNREQEFKTTNRIQQSHVNPEENVKILSCLSNTAKNNLIINFIRSLKIPKAELLLLDEGKLRFIIQKISVNRPTLKQMLLSKLQVVKLALIDQTKLKQTSPSQTVPAETVSYLISLNYSKNNAVRALQICRNDLYNALAFLNGIFKQPPVQFKLNKESLVTQFISIAEWISKESNKPFLLCLKHRPSDLPIFINCYKHSCHQLFQTMIRWQQYLPTLIEHCCKEKA